jgi:hypothetical protein
MVPSMMAFVTERDDPDITLPCPAAPFNAEIVETELLRGIRCETTSSE